MSQTTVTPTPSTTFTGEPNPLLIDALEREAHSDHALYRGKLLATTYLKAGNGDDILDIDVPKDMPPILVRVDDHPIADDDLIWHDEFLDPYWSVTLAAPHPLMEGLYALWVDGIAYNGITGESEPVSYWTVKE